MKLKKPDGEITEASISEGINIVISIGPNTTGVKNTKDLKSESLDPNDCELIDATDVERRLLKKAGYKMKGL